MSWDENALWSKAKIHIDRAMKEDRTSENFPFWIALSLELLARAALSSVSPLLLAAPAKDDFASILYALRKPIGKAKPRSRDTAGVLNLCRQLVPDFGDDELKISLALADLRNEELHSGGSPFTNLPPSTWLTHFYRAADALCRFQKRNLQGLLGDEEYAAAQTMMSVDTANVKAKVQKTIHSHREAFLLKPDTEQKRLRKQSESRANTMAWEGGHKVTCPACQATTYIRGTEFAFKDPVLEDGEIVVRTTMLPAKLKCDACGLALDTHAELVEAGIGVQYTRTQRSDPLDYYSQDMYDGPEYDNE